MKPKQNPDRYTEREAEWQIQSAPGITPLVLKKGERPALIPVLKADGIVVELNGRYLISSGTLAELGESPHWDLTENGKVLGKGMGKTVPIIKLNATGLGELGNARDRINLYAGVESVDYLNEGPKDSYGLPVGLIDQINWTLTESGSRPADTFRIWELGLKADYSIAPFIIQTAQSDGTLDKAKLQEFLKGMNQRLKAIGDDTNRIKLIYYKGQSPNTSTYSVTRIATSDDPDDANRDNSTNFILRNTDLIGVQSTPGQQVAAGLAAVSAAATPADGNLLAAPTDPAIIAKWQAWGWSAAESAALKTPNYVGNELVELNGRSVNIAILWTPGMETKGRIIGQLTPSTSRDLLRELYGSKPISGYGLVNRRRKADILATAADIVEIERRTGRTY